MGDLKQLEPQICDLDNMATIAADIVNNLNMETTPDGALVVRQRDLELFSFAINQVEALSTQLRQSFYASISSGVADE